MHKWYLQGDMVIVEFSLYFDFFLMYVIGILPFQFEIVLAWLLNVFNLTCEYSFSFTYILFFLLMLYV